MCNTLKTACHRKRIDIFLPLSTQSQSEVIPFSIFDNLVSGKRFSIERDGPKSEPLG